MSLDLEKIKNNLENFDFSELFIGQLGWSCPNSTGLKNISTNAGSFDYLQIAELSGVFVLHLPQKTDIPDPKTRQQISKKLSELYPENILIFTDSAKTQSLWLWVKTDNGKAYPREHIFIKGQPADLFLSKLKSLHFDFSDFSDTGHVALSEVTKRLKDALDVERVTKRFYQDFQRMHLEFLGLIEGINDEKDRRWYASVLLNRLMFIYFLQGKLFLDNGDARYLQNKLDQSKAKGKDIFYEVFLKALFFEGFAKPEDKRSKETNDLLGKIKYLNGGLFLRHRIEIEYKDIKIPDIAFENLLKLFSSYSWNLNDTIGGKADEINPDVLGYIFEKYINQKAFGAYYTRPEITEYLCSQTIHKLVLDSINSPGHPGVFPAINFESIGELILRLDAPLCKKLIYEVLPKMRLLDPACGSGAFLVQAMKKLVDIYSAVIGRIEFLSDSNLKAWVEDIKTKHPSINYFIKKKIITDNLYGVDIMEEAVEIAKLRLFLALVSSVSSASELEPLPNIDFNILPGNSLIGLMKVDDVEFENRNKNLFRKSYQEILDEKNRQIETFRHATTYAEDLASLRDGIAVIKQNAQKTLDEILKSEFDNLGIKFEQATWDEAKNKEGKPVKRAVSIADIEALHPFHWGFEFDEVINARGGFDAIITNPPWDVYQIDEKEFFQNIDSTIQKKKLRIEDWKEQFNNFMKDEEIRKIWFGYISNHPHTSEYFKKVYHFTGKINLNVLFVEQCFNLLRKGGYCGIVVPSGIYTDLGTKQLRQMLFDKTQITGLFCFENRKGIFENVDSRFKFVVLTFEKGGKTTQFPAAFMRHEVSELQAFPKQGSIEMDVGLVKRLSPDSLSVMEFKKDIDIKIAEKMLKHPLLGEEIPDKWNIALKQGDFNMTSDSHLFKTEPGPGRLPLYEGKMIHQFDHKYAKPKYWIDEAEGRKALLGRNEDKGQKLDYQKYRFGYREVAASTNERSLIGSIIPEYVFCNHKIIFVSNCKSINYYTTEMFFICSLFNSFIFDYQIRQRVSSMVSIFVCQQLPIPRFTEKDPQFMPIVSRAARLICTTPEFDELSSEVGLGSHKNGITDPAERAKLRSELDGLVAHLYGVTREEFQHILSTFPIVAQEVRDAALRAYDDVAKGKIK